MVRKRERRLLLFCGSPRTSARVSDALRRFLTLGRLRSTRRARMLASRSQLGIGVCSDRESFKVNERLFDVLLSLVFFFYVESGWEPVVVFVLRPY